MLAVACYYKPIARGCGVGVGAETSRFLQLTDQPASLTHIGSSKPIRDTVSKERWQLLGCRSYWSEEQMQAVPARKTGSTSQRNR